ncbi:hypothetical protein [Novosphingopyxis baekryungensis]|uniref:NAD(P)H-dependent amine dehydrogenase family protein n=1 Tax=Novosphingopyxis baekryungensis TaxID=279369 RepID=UPI0003B699F2|nr:hypothetical protein [Novosphingopyxis baekryungensis]
MTVLRIVQWTTGKVGMQALRAIMDDPRLELVGLFAHSAGKVGRDAGELVGRGAAHVIATADITDIIALKPDAVIYTPFKSDMDNVLLLLRSGINVVSTNLFIDSGGMTGDNRARLLAACIEGKSSLFITGVNPGWINMVTAGLTSVCRRVDHISVRESADVSNYASRETWVAQGMGQTEVNDDVIAVARGALISFRDAVLRLAEALSLPLDDVDFELEHAVTSETVDLGFMSLPKGSNGALRAEWVGKADGCERIRLSVSWYLTRALDSDWTFDDEHYHIDIDGEPSIRTIIDFVAPEWKGSDWSILTALPAVNAISAVVAAQPGILGPADVPLISAARAAWSGTPD